MRLLNPSTSLAPSRRLARFIDRFWSWEPSPLAPLPEMLPGTGAECFFNLHHPMRVIEVGTGASQWAPQAFLLCHRSQVLQFESAEPTRFIAIRFRAGQLRRFVPFAFAELQDRLTPVADLWPSLSDSWQEAFQQKTTFCEQAHWLDAFFCQQLRSAQILLLDALLAALYRTPSMRIEALAEQAGWSRRHLDRRFLATFGISPKYFARSARLQQLARQMALRPETGLLRRILDAGYFDQAHFNHDLYAMTGFSPARLQSTQCLRPHFYFPSLNA